MAYMFGLLSQWCDSPCFLFDHESEEDSWGKDYVHDNREKPTPHVREECVSHDDSDRHCNYGDPPVCPPRGWGPPGCGLGGYGGPPNCTPPCPPGGLYGSGYPNHAGYGGPLPHA